MAAIYVALILLGELLGVVTVSRVVYRILKKEAIKDINRKRNAKKHSFIFRVRRFCYV